MNANGGSSSTNPREQGFVESIGEDGGRDLRCTVAEAGAVTAALQGMDDVRAPVSGGLGELCLPADSSDVFINCVPGQMAPSILQLWEKDAESLISSTAARQLAVVLSALAGVQSA